MTLTRLHVGAPWPYGAHPDGMIAMIQPGEGALDVMLACHVSGLSGDELSALRSRPIRLGVWSSPPLTWLLLSTQGEMSLDAPYAAGIADSEHAAGIWRCATAMVDMQPPRRLLITVAVIDRGVTRALRGVTVSADCGRALAAAILASPKRLSQADYAAAIDRDSRLSTPQMLAAAQVVETAGRM